MSSDSAARERFSRSPALVGMVHVQALPGAPRHHLAMEEIVAIAVQEARLLEECGFDAILVENMHDLPYVARVACPLTVAAMAAVACAVRAAVRMPIGVHVLAGANRESIAVAKASGATFIRAEGFVFAHVGDEGLMSADAGELLRFRRAADADHIAVFADIKKKHSSHAITADVSLEEAAEAAELFLADGVVVTGTATGKPTSPDDLRAARRGTRLPILVGSGVTPENLPELWPLADAFVVGSDLKEEGRWDRPIDPARARRIVQAAERLRAAR